MAVSIDLTGKRGVVFGVANQRSIAWAISERLAEAGAELAFTYQNERLRQPVEKATSALGSPMLIQCDATDDDQVQAVYDQIKNDWDEIDFVVHCIAYAERGRFFSHKPPRVPNRTGSQRLYPDAGRRPRRAALR